MDILQAMADPQLFAKVFKRSWLGRDTWQAWRVFLAALFGLPLDDDARVIYEKHTDRSDVPTEQFREAYAICGRRAGKSLLASLVGVYLACFRDYSQVLTPGEMGVCMLLAADRKQAQVLFRYISAFFDIPLLSKMVVSRTRETIELENRISVEVHTSDYRAVRGRTLVCCICDELSFWNWEEGANPDSEVLTAVRPGLATTNGLLLGISSPYSKRGALWQAFKDHYAKDGDPVLVWRSDSRSMNPTLSVATVTAAYVRDAASARAEYGGEFRDDIESFLPLQVLEACVVPGRLELPSLGDVSYTAFVDPSGGASDSMTLAIAHCERDCAVLDVLRERQPPFSPEQVVAEFAGTLKQYRISTVTGDRYAGEWPREQFAKRGIEYRPGETSRSELYLELLPAVMSGQVELLDNARLTTQLVSLERRTSRGARDSVDHPPGGHDDVANAAAGVLVEVLGVGSGEHGLLEYWKRVAAGTIPHPDTPVMLSADQQQKTREAALRFEAELRGIKELRPTFNEPRVVPCEKCGMCLAVRIANIRHCNSCGYQWFPDGPPEVARVTRADYLAGRYKR